MENAKHTQGPLHVDNDWDKVVRDQGCALVAQTNLAKDAQLISAAPSMLESLEWAVKFIEDHCEAENSDDLMAYKKAKKAISSALGKD